MCFILHLPQTGRQVLKSISARFISDMAQARHDNDSQADHDKKAQYYPKHFQPPSEGTGTLTSWQVEHLSIYAN